MRRVAAIAAIGLGASTARADVLAYDGFAYPPGSIDGAAGGVGWSTAARAPGSGGTDGACDGVTCACPEQPDDARVVRGHAGAAWTTSALTTAHDVVLASGLRYPGLPVTGGAVQLIDPPNAPTGGVRSFRAIDLTRAAAAAHAVHYAVGPGGGDHVTLGAGTIWISMLMRLDCTGCTAAVDARNGGIHLFDGIGALDTSGGRDGPKHPFEHLQVGDRNQSGNWILARTMGACAGGAGTWEPTDAAGASIPFDAATHLIVIRVRFDAATPPCTGVTGCACPPANPSCLEELAAWIDPDLSGAIGTSPTAATGVLRPLAVADFAFDTVQLGAEGEVIDLDELRIGETYADVVGATCAGLPDATPCTDGDPATVGETCQAGRCVAGVAPAGDAGVVDASAAPDDAGALPIQPRAAGCCEVGGADLGPLGALAWVFRPRRRARRAATATALSRP